MKTILKPVIAIILFCSCLHLRAQVLRLDNPPQYHPGAFVHPGLLHTANDLQRMKDMVAKNVEPWKSGFEVFKASPYSSAQWVPHPAEHVERSLLAGAGKHIGDLEKDVCAAYQNALMWAITGDEAHAKKAVEIINAWSKTLTIFDGTDVELGAGLCGFKLTNAAEIMRTYSGWAPADIKRCQEMLMNVFYPPIQYFALWAHGNWDLACMKEMMAIGVFCDDHALFDKAVDFYYKGPGNGSLTHYIINRNGQVQESGRDQQHTQLGIGHLAEMCEVGWSQGMDMYGADDNLLLKGYEYTAKYNLGEDVPFEPYTDISGRFPASHISESGRGKLRSIYEMVLNHYKYRAHLPAAQYKYTEMAADKLRPEGAGFNADNPGFGTLLFTLPAAAQTVVAKQTEDASQTAEWQWSVSVDSLAPPNSSGYPRAFLWIPPDCRRVRGVVVGQNNMLEEGILQHPDFRKTLAKLGFAEIFIAPTFDTWQNAAGNDAVNKKFDAMLESLADESGYAELKFAPIVPIGHSAMASFPWNFAAWNPQRTLAILSVHGDAPQTNLVGNGRPNVNWGDRTIDGIPGLMVMGEYEWWEKRIAPAFAFEAKYPATPVAFFCDAGNGHFNSSDQLVAFLGMFIRKAAAWRLPAYAPPDGPVTLKAVDPRQGWLMDRWRHDELPMAVSAPYEKYTGDRREAFWCFDQEMARMAEGFYARQRGKLPQLVDVVQDGKTVPVNPKAFELIHLKFPPLDNTLTFYLQGTFLDTVPPGNPQNWTGLTNGTVIGHATDNQPVTISRITGPVEQLAPDVFAIRFNRLSDPGDRRMGDVWLIAKHPGNLKYKSAVEQALMKIPFRLTEGAEQTISFPKIPDRKTGIQSQTLNAASNAGVPVYYYIRQGPATVKGNVITFTRIPPRAKFPVKVTVVAWQYGRNTDPKVQSAAPVEQSFYIIK